MRFSATRQNNNVGIAIGPILFIVAILAILATAIAAGSSTFSAGTDQEAARVNASAIIDVASTLRAAVARVTALGCSDTQISFENPIVSGYTNSNAPADKHCHIFDIAGGGIIFPVPPTTSLTANANYFFSGATQALNSGTTCGDSSCNELEMTLGYIRDGVCKQINELIQKQNAIAMQSSPYDLAIGNSKFVGTYNYFSQNIIALNGSFDSTKIMCFKPGGSDAYFLYVILLAR